MEGTGWKRRGLTGRGVEGDGWHLLDKDFEKVVQHVGGGESLDEDEEGDGGDAAVERVVEAHLAQELHQQQRVPQPKALVLCEGEEEVEVGVVVAVERGLQRVVT